MSKKKIVRPNRIVKLPRELYQCLDCVAYFQENPISTNDFIENILWDIARIYGDQMQQEALEGKEKIQNYVKRSRILEDNERYMEDLFRGINV